MTSVAALPTAEPVPSRRPVPRRFVMCRPDHFEVAYCINPWMRPGEVVDRVRALAQWESLRATFVEYGHQVEVVPGEPGLPDMVFAANGGIAVGDRVMTARFSHAERAAEGPAYLNWFTGRGGAEVVAAGEINEGQGDFAFIGGRFLAGTGFRTTPAAHREVENYFEIPVVALELVDPRYYHLDTALMVLDDHTVAYYPPAFSETSRIVLAGLFPDAVLATDADAEVLGLNGVSDGRHVFLSPYATDLAAALRARGYLPVGVDMSELLKAGGGPKCCTLEVVAAVASGLGAPDPRYAA